MHVLQCYKTAHPLSMGGVEQVMHHIAAGLVEQGHESSIIAFARQKNIQELQYQGYRVIVVPLLAEFASMPLSTQGFSVFKEWVDKADLVHYHYPFPWMDLMHWVHPHDKPCVMTYHSDIVKQKHLLKLYRPLQDYFLKRMDAIVATSPKYIESSDTLKQYANKVSCIPLGLDEGIYAGVTEEKRLEWKQKLPERFLLFVGVFRYYKGLEYLLQALQGLDYPVVLIGDGPEKTKLVSLKEQLKLKHLSFLGSLDDDNKNAVLSLSSGVILPSHLRSEAFGLSLLEGAIFSKPLISCEISTGTSYINQHQSTGWVAEPSDVNSLRLQLQQWFEQPEQGLIYGQNARRRYESLFQASAMVRDYLKLYQSLC